MNEHFRSIIVRLLCRCPGTRQALSAAAERRTLTAYTLYEGLMRAVNAEDPAAPMDIAGSQALTPQLLLGGLGAQRAGGGPLVPGAHQVSALFRTKQTLQPCS